MKILVSGFCAFANFDENITQKLLSKLPDKIEDNEIFKVILPVEYEKAFLLLDKVAQQFKPDYIISTGMAASRKCISIERIALNINNSDTPDNAGVLKKDSLITPKSNAAHFSTLDYPKSVYDIELVKNSYSAGTYVCNDLFFRLLDKDGLNSNLGISFIHFPSEDNIPYEKQLSILIDILSLL